MKPTDEQRLLRALDNIPATPASPCSYLEGRFARNQAFYWDRAQGRVPGTLYQDLMDQRFRRSGRVFYRPQCGACDLCIPIRIDVDAFVPTASHRRVARRNQDVKIRWSTPELDVHKIDMYERYVAARHGGQENAAGTLEEFLYDSPTDTVEATYWADGRLLGAGICDLTPESLSTVYFYFDPDESRRGLGTFSALMEIEAARRMGRHYYYLGYWVPGSPKMEYKARLGPHELLGIDGWKPAARSSAAPPAPVA